MPASACGHAARVERDWDAALQGPCLLKARAASAWVEIHLWPGRDQQKELFWGRRLTGAIGAEKLQGGSVLRRLRATSTLENPVSLCKRREWLQGGVKLGLNPSPDLPPHTPEPLTVSALKTRHRAWVPPCPPFHHKSLLRISRVLY